MTARSPAWKTSTSTLCPSRSLRSSTTSTLLDLWRMMSWKSTPCRRWLPPVRPTALYAMCSWVTPTAILGWAPSAQRKLLQPFAVASLQQRSTWSLFAEASGVTESVCLTLCPWRCTASAAQCEHAWSQPRVDPELSALLWWRRWWPSLALVTASLAPAATPEPQPILQRLPSKHWRLPTDIWLQTFGSPPPMWSLLSRSGLTTLHSRSRLLATTESLRMRGQLGVVEKDCALNCSFFCTP